MDRFNLKYTRLAGLFTLGCMLLSFPIVSLFNSARTAGGIPLLYAYLYFTWAILILLAWGVTRFTRTLPPPKSRNRK